MNNIPLHTTSIEEAFTTYGADNLWTNPTPGVWHRVKSVAVAVGGFGYVVDGKWYAPDRKIYVDVFSEPSKRKEA